MLLKIKDNSIILFKSCFKNCSDQFKNILNQNIYESEMMPNNIYSKCNRLIENKIIIQRKLILKSLITHWLVI